MKNFTFLALLLLLVTLPASGSEGITFFGEQDYLRLLNKYVSRIEDGSFSFQELQQEVSGIHSSYITCLYSSLLEKMKISGFFRQVRDPDQNLAALQAEYGKASRATPTIAELEFSPITVTQYTAKRAYISNPFHYPMTNWYYDWTEVEPFMLGIKGSREDNNFSWSSERSWSNWYRLCLTFDITGLSAPLNIISAYIRISNCNFYWGKDEEDGMSVAYLTTTEVSTFYHLDTFGIMSEATVKPHSYGSNNERLTVGPLDDVISYWLNGYAHAIVLNFKPLSDRDHGSWFYATRIFRRNIKLVIRYET
ncbi:MAG: hypothetical protein PHQ23_11590 [Candidatus Wallbacteria bacterium]|nr:hypothetical protein [Candidatus Wallbacteria bacterium]